MKDFVGYPVMTKKGRLLGVIIPPMKLSAFVKVLQAFEEEDANAQVTDARRYVMREVSDG